MPESDPLLLRAPVIWVQERWFSWQAQKNLQEHQEYRIDFYNNLSTSLPITHTSSYHCFLVDAHGVVLLKAKPIEIEPGIKNSLSCVRLYEIVTFGEVQ